MEVRDRTHEQRPLPAFMRRLLGLTPPSVKDYAMRAGFAPGECPHALVVWREIRLPSGRPHFVPEQVRCEVEARLIPHREHAGAGHRWR